jgi:hypothetical protein
MTRFGFKRYVLWAGFCLLRLQVLLFPFQASRSGSGNKPDPASPVLHFPLLSAVVEFEVAGAGDFELAKFM